MAIQEDLRAEARRRRDAGLAVYKAYDIKQELKDAGAIWDPRLKAWLIPSHDVARELRLVYVPETATGKRQDWVEKVGGWWQCTSCEREDMLDWDQKCCHECGNHAGGLFA